MQPIIQSLWIGRPLSLLERLSITSFLQAGHEYHLYCYEEIEGVPPGVTLRAAAEILPAAEIFYYRKAEGKGSVAAFANWFRYKLLLERGGWWCDTDVICVRPFDFEEDAICASERTENGGQQIATSVIRLPAGHPAARECCRIAAEKRRNKLNWGETGNPLLHEVVRKCPEPPPTKSPEVFCPVNWWEWQSLLREDNRTLADIITAETRAIHCWHEMWRRTRVEMKIGGAQPCSFPDWLRPFGKKAGADISPSSLLAGLLRQNGVLP